MRMRREEGQQAKTAWQSDGGGGRCKEEMKSEQAAAREVATITTTAGLATDRPATWSEAVRWVGWAVHPPFTASVISVEAIQGVK